jgi:hypothetical protein
VGFVCGVGTTRCCPPCGTANTLEILTEHLDEPTGHRLKFMLARKPLLPLELLGWPFAPWPWNGQGSKWIPVLDVVGSSLPTVWRQCRGCPSDADTPCPPHCWRARATCPRAQPQRPHSSWPWQRWEATTLQGWLLRPDLPRAPIRISVGQPVWPQRSPAWR